MEIAAPLGVRIARVEASLSCLDEKLGVERPVAAVATAALALTAARA